MPGRGEASGKRTVIQMEQVVALDERVDRVALAVGVGQLTDDACVLLVEVIRQPAQLKGLQFRSSEELRTANEAGKETLTIQKDSLSPVTSSPLSARRDGKSCKGRDRVSAP